jgi:tetratricopeptide (TPR) repeat protein
MAASVVEEDPELAWQHALLARGLGARSGAVREAVGLIAYQAGRYAEALAELRTARRITGSHEHLPVLADCERGLGRPERALDLAGSPEVADLDRDGQVEMLIVAAGARSDLGDHAAAVATLELPWLNDTTPSPWLARLRSAYADALSAVGRDEEAEKWLNAAAEVDVDGHTGAGVRLGLVSEGDEDESDEDDGAEDEGDNGQRNSEDESTDSDGADDDEPLDDGVGAWIDLDEAPESGSNRGGITR